MRVADQAFVASQKGKGKGGSSFGKQKAGNTAQSKKEDKNERKVDKKKMFCSTVRQMIMLSRRVLRLLRKRLRRKSLVWLLLQMPLLLPLNLQMLCRIQNGHSVHNAVMTHCCMIHVCLLWI